MGAPQTRTKMMAEGFVPRRRGRRPLVDIDPFITAVRLAQGRWVSFEIPSSSEANSVLRQLRKEGDVETTSALRESGKTVYARVRLDGAATRA